MATIREIAATLAERDTDLLAFVASFIDVDLARLTWLQDEDLVLIAPHEAAPPTAQPIALTGEQIDFMARYIQDRAP